MIDDVTRRFFIKQAALLAEPLYECLDSAVYSDERLSYSESRFPHAWALHRRALFRVALEDMTLPEGWVVRGNTRQTVQTVLRHAGGGSLRLLSASRVTKNGVPHAGYNKARREAWGESVPVPLWDEAGDVVADRNMLLLMDLKAEQPTLNIAHPTEPGKYKGTVKCDFVLAMIRSIDALGGVKFETEDSPEDFFAIDAEEEGLDD